MAFSRLTLSLGSVNTYGFMFYSGALPISLKLTDFSETPSMRSDNRFISTDLYEPVEGEFTFRVQGPTPSGIMGVMYQIENILDYAKQFANQKGKYPVTLNVNGKSVLLLEGSIEYNDIHKLQTLETLFATIKYKRRGLVGDAPTTVNSTSLSYSSINSRIDVPYNTTLSTQNLILSPTDLVFKMFNTDRYIPSGYLLVSNQPIFSISGAAFVTGSPSVFATYNENVNNAFATYAGATTGVLGFRPTDLNTYTTSGTVYPNVGSITSPVIANPGVYKADIYAKVKTSFSGTLYGVSLLVTGEPTLYGAQTVRTQETILGNYMNPTAVYLGRVESTLPLSLSQLRLQMRSTNIASGILQIDQLTIHSVDDDSSKAIALNTFDGLLPQEVATATTFTSGNTALEIFSNYLPGTSDPKNSLYPVIRYYRETAAANTIAVPSYYGNPLIFNRTSDYDYTSTGTTSRISVLMFATGSTYQTVSGLRYWNASDRHNNKIRTAVSAGKIAAPVLTMYDHTSQ
jgi:hypothetical protein